MFQSRSRPPAGHGGGGPGIHLPEMDFWPKNLFIPGFVAFLDLDCFGTSLLKSVMLNNPKPTHLWEVILAGRLTTYGNGDV
jgi:hypothetical protein